MKYFFRYAGVLLMLLLIAVPASLQDETTDDSTSEGVISVGGSGIAAQVFNALVEANESADAFEVNVTGTDAGIANFCGGTTDITLTTRVLTQPEGGNCDAAGVEFYEILLGYDAYAFAVQEGFTAVDCMSSVEETAIFAPSSGGNVLNWSDVNPDVEDLPLTVYLPSPNTTTYALVDAQLPGDGFRSDAQLMDSFNAILEAVAGDEGGIGLVSLSAAQNAEGVELLPLRALTGNCFDASAENISDGVYPAATGLFAYVSAGAMENEAVRAVFDSLIAEGGAQVVADAGFTAPAADDISDMETALTNSETGRTFSGAVVAYQISPGVTGNVTTGGTAAAFAYVNGLTQLASQQYSALTIDADFAGQASGADAFCNGSLNVLYVSGGLTGEQSALCETNEVTYIEQPLGAQTVVLLANANSDYLSCLTTDQLNTIWNVNAGDELPENWSALGGDLPDAEMFLFAPRQGDVTTSVLLTAIADGPAIEREATENNSDPLYRAAATANVEGALTYMSWRDYQRVLDNGQEGVQLVSVDAGNGCVAPSVEAVADGTYGLTRPVTMLVNRDALAQDPVKAFVWYTFSDQNFSRLEGAGFVGLNLGDFADIRETFQTAFEEVDAEAAAAAALQLDAPAESTEGEDTTTEGDEAESTETEETESGEGETETEESEGGEG